MVMSSVLYRRARISTLAGIVGISATILVAFSSPAEARRKHRRVSGGYAPPYAPVWDPILIAARKAAEAVERG